MSDTPRTDAAESVIYLSAGCPVHVVPSSLSRDLENEVTRLRKALTEVSMCPNILAAHFFASQALHLPCTDAGCERCCG